MAVVLGGTLLGVVQVAAFVHALHRYRTGVEHPIMVSNAPWSPPVPAAPAVRLYAVLQAVLLVWVAGLLGPETDPKG
jgi:hypothetical protein